MTSTKNSKPIVIGFCGLPGTGKTTLLGRLREHLGVSRFEYFEGSEVIASLVPGGLAAFKNAIPLEKSRFREDAIKSIKKTCETNNKIGIVTGHFMFWEEENDAATAVLTQADLEIYTHFVYLRTDPSIVAHRREQDKIRGRSKLSVSHLTEWQNEEVQQLRDLCRLHCILFGVITASEPLAQALRLIEDFAEHTETVNLARAKKIVDKVASSDQLETVLVVDADKTLAVDDASAKFWQAMPDGERPLLGRVFQGPLRFSYEAFRQIALLYEEVTNEKAFEETCWLTAAKVKMHPEMIALLKRALATKHTTAVVVTCGLRRLWEMILRQHDLQEVKVVGGGRIKDGIVVTREVKGQLVTHLRTAHNMYVCAIGDSHLDLDMLMAANKAIVVAGPKKTRSRSIEDRLQEVLDGGLKAEQVRLPPNSPELECDPLPFVRLDGKDFTDTIFCHRVTVITAPDSATKLLMTPTRNAEIFGPSLREAHRRIGRYLTTNFVSEIVGVERYPIPHVQSRSTDGYRVANEKRTTIIALLRGGEPMAFGVSDVMPNAMFVHAHTVDDVKRHHLDGQATAILVDSVINTGKSIVDFIFGIRSINPQIKIVVVAGVVQQEAVRDKGGERAILSKELGHLEDVTIVALRISENKYTGSGTTDTGNRLFNTPQIL